MNTPKHSDSYKTLTDWISQETIPFSLDSPDSFKTAIDRIISSSREMKVLGFGEALHGSRDILQLRNLLFKYLVEKHGFRAIAIESSFPRSRIVNEYISGTGPTTYDEMQDTGFSHGFGQIDANRELVEWMRKYNTDPSHSEKLHFYGCDGPIEMTSCDSPRELLNHTLDYLISYDPDRGRDFQEQIKPLLLQDSDWENPDIIWDPSLSVGLSPEATALRIKTEDLISELHIRRPEFVALSDNNQFQEALQYALVARQLLNYHAEMARKSKKQIARLLGIRDTMIADILGYIITREQERGKVFVFAHNSHLQSGKTEWLLGNILNIWWPAGSHLKEIYGPRYVVIGTGIGSDNTQGILAPESGTLEDLLTTVSGPARIISTEKVQQISESVKARLPVRSRSEKNSTYFPLTSQSLTDFDWLIILDFR